MKTTMTIPAAQRNVVLAAHRLTSSIESDMGKTKERDENPGIPMAGVPGDLAMGQRGRVHMQTQDMVCDLNYDPQQNIASSYSFKVLRSVNYGNGQVDLAGTESTFQRSEDGSAVYRKVTPSLDGQVKHEEALLDAQGNLTYNEWIVTS